jgi:multidrug efflux pump subunit AcrB
MNLATWSIRNPIPAILLFVLLSIAGLRAFYALPVQNFPDLLLPEVTITAVQPGAAPPQLETEVARPIEDSLTALDGLRHVTTTVTDGMVRVSATFDVEKPVSDALVQTKDAIDSIRADLPTDLLPPTVAATPFGTEAVLIYSVSSSRMSAEALSWFIDERLAREIRAIPGVGRIERIGGGQREVTVEVDPVLLAGLGVTAGDVSRALRQVQQQSSGGRGQLAGAEQSIRTIATAALASDLEALPVTLPGGGHARLDQVATVRDGIAEPVQAAFLDGKPVIGFAVYRARGADEGAVADGVIEALDNLKAADPALTLKQVGGSIDYTREQYEGSMAMLYEGALLAVIVVWLFLRDWRATLVAAAALPLSILPTFAAMQLLGFSLNTLTLLALAVVVGILIDDAIVEVENTERHRRLGKPVIQATEDAVTEIALPVIATTMSLVVVFLPTALMTGFGGLIFRQFGWTAVIAVLASLLVARVLTPLMAAYMLGGKPPPERPDGRIMRGYLAAVRWCLAHRWMTVAASAAFLVGSLALLPLIPTGFLPPDNRSVTGLSLELPPGTSLATTAVVAEEVRLAVKDVDGIAAVFTTIGQGSGEGDAGEVRRAGLTLILAPGGERPSKTQIESAVRPRLAAVPGGRFTVGEGGEGGLELVLAGDDAAALKATAQQFERELRGIGRLSNVNSTASLERPEIVIRPDLHRAAELGVTAADIGDVVRIATSGDFDAQIARLDLDSRQVLIRTRIPDAARRDLQTLAALRVPGRDGLVALDSVASLGLESGPSRIDRYDRMRFITVSADLNGMPLSQALAAVNDLPSIRAMPSSVSLIPAGEAEVAGELMGGFITALAAGVLCVFCVLVLLFKNVLQPITILSAIPLSVGGALVALLVAGSELDVPSMIGLVMLMGIVTKNSILLVEYAMVGIAERGQGVLEALIEACHKRARPIVMTSLAMISGMAPIALGLGADASFRQPMAIAVIGGLLTSTALSLLVVPAAFSLIHDLEKAFGRWRWRQ